ncbi:MAG: DUF421 domain-containing protein [Micrococcaceae bacterium]|nr:DUF421 domain-containing protein [Micrococcaceae bacterium]
MDAFSVTPEQLRDSLGLELWRIPIVIITAIVIYLACLLLLRLFGARVLSGLTGFDVVVGIMFGSVAGRVIVGDPPTLTAGIIGLATLLTCEAIFGQIRSNINIHKVLHVQPTVVLAHGKPQPDLMRKTHVTHDDIMSSLRRAGISDPAQARCIVLEPSGSLSVLRRGTPLDPQVLENVLGAERVLSQDSPDLD